MGICSKITSNILANCDKPLVGGVKDKLVLVNLEDIEALTRNEDNPQIIEGVTLVEALIGFLLEGINNSIDAKTALVKKKYSNGWDHDIVFRIIDNSPEIKEQVEKLVGGRVVAFLENNFKGTDDKAAFEVYGSELGLIVKSVEADKSNADTQGGLVITLGCADEYKEPHMPASFFITDYTTTKAAFEALYTTEEEAP
jgi:hypothetical protein